MMIFKIILLLIALPLFGGEDKNPIVVKLESETKLLPLYASRLSFDHPELAMEQLQELEKILRFDLGHNGSTALVAPSNGLEALELGSPESWQKAKIYYAVKAHVSGKKLALSLLTVNAGALKTVEAISLTGNP